jgi:ribonucleoside-diphosphate reductase alpha chain
MRFELKVGGHSMFLKTFEYSDGSLGEIWIEMHREGGTMRSMINQFCRAVSLGLQHGIPLSELIEMFTLISFEPAGIVVGHDNVKMANSVVDAIFRILAVEYLADDELAQIKLTEERKAEILGLDDEDEEEEVKTSVRTKTVSSSTRPTSMPIISRTTIMGTPSEIVQEIRPTAEPIGGPPCEKCGGDTIRTGACFCCTNCGTSAGCS